MERVSLCQIKELVGQLERDHPMRIMILGEPDEMPRSEYGSKVLGRIPLLHLEKR